MEKNPLCAQPSGCAQGAQGCAQGCAPGLCAGLCVQGCAQLCFQRRMVVRRGCAQGVVRRGVRKDRAAQPAKGLCVFYFNGFFSIKHSRFVLLFRNVLCVYGRYLPN